MALFERPFRPILIKLSYPCNDCKVLYELVSTHGFPGGGRGGGTRYVGVPGDVSFS